MAKPSKYATHVIPENGLYLTIAKKRQKIWQVSCFSTKEEAEAWAKEKLYELHGPKREAAEREIANKEYDQKIGKSLIDIAEYILGGGKSTKAKRDFEQEFSLFLQEAIYFGLVEDIEDTDFNLKGKAEFVVVNNSLEKMLQECFATLPTCVDIGPKKNWSLTLPRVKLEQKLEKLWHTAYLAAVEKCDVMGISDEDFEYHDQIAGIVADSKIGISYMERKMKALSGFYDTYENIYIEYEDVEKAHVEFDEKIQQEAKHELEQAFDGEDMFDEDFDDLF